MGDELTPFGLGQALVTHVAKSWMKIRSRDAERGVELSQLISTRVVDEYRRRRLTRQLQDIGDDAAKRLAPLFQAELGRIPRNEVEAAMATATEALIHLKLDDELFFSVDFDPYELARTVRQAVPDRARNALLSPAASALYERVIDESCVTLVHIVQKLPQFDSRAISEMLSRFSDISEQISVLLDRLPRERLTGNSSDVNDDEFRKRYLRHLSETLDELELFGVDVRNYRPRTLVSTAYLSLRARSNSVDEGVYDDVLLGEHNRRLNSGKNVEDAVGSSQRVLLRGEAGSGKTTFLQWLAVNCARSKFTGKLAAWNGRVPFFVRLRAFADVALPSPDEFVKAAAPVLHSDAPEGWAMRMLGSGAVLLVDGIDELAPSQRTKVRSWLRGILVEHIDLFVIVTSRPAAAREEWLGSEQFTPLFLEPMRPEQIKQFSKKWHQAIAEASRSHGAQLPCSYEEIADYDASVRRHLEQQPHLMSLATTPLLCAMLCALNLDRRKHLPPDRMSLYNAAIELLVSRRDIERDVPAANSLALGTTSKLALLQSLAWRMQLAGKAQIRRDKMDEQVSRTLERMPNVAYEGRETSTYLIERSGVIREPVMGQVDFIHRTFQEFLAAKEAISEDGIDILVKNAHLDQWRETVIMAAGHATTAQRADLVEGIVSRAAFEPRSARRLKVLAASCIDMMTVLSEPALDAVDRALSTLVPPRHAGEARSLSLAGERVLHALPGDLSELSEAAAAGCVATAALVGGAPALSKLETYANDARYGPQSELSKAWEYYDPSVFASAVLANSPLLQGVFWIRSKGQLRNAAKLKNLTSTIALLSESELVDPTEVLTNLPRVLSLSANLGPGAELPVLGDYPSLTYLSMTGNPVTNFSAVSQFSKLETLGLVLPENTSELDIIGELPIRRIRIWGIQDSCDFSFLSAFTKLEELSLYGHVSMAALARGVSPSLIADDLRLSSMVNDVDAPQLRPLIERASAVRLVDSYVSRQLLMLLRSCERLETLWLDRSRVETLEPLSMLTRVKEVSLFGCQMIPSLSPLCELESLQVLDLRGVLGIVDLGQLRDRSVRLRVIVTSRINTINAHVLPSEVEVTTAYHVPS